jgi:colanic acid biosynthesis glycosyl transferase WcaI
MHIAFFNRSFYPDDAATGQLLTELCEGLLREHGCRVSVVAGVPLLPAVGDGTSPASGGIIRREQYQGIEILRARGTRFSKRRFSGRFSNYVSYFLSACYAGLRLDHPDVVVALTDPPIIGLAAYLAARRFGVPLVMSYRDIFPEVARLLEDFQSEAVNRVLEGVNRVLVRKAERSIALGETIRQRLIDGKGADPARTLVIPDWADCAEIVPGPRRNPLSLAHGLADAFVVMHSGNIGLSQGLEVVVEAAAHLRDVPDIQFVFVGDGVKRPALEAQARALSLQNVRFLPYQPKERLSESFASADVFVVSLKPGLAGYIVPSKLYGILAAGRPYVAAVEDACEVAAISRKYDCGLAVEPGDAKGLAQRILTLYHDRALAQRLGVNARQAALVFDRSPQVRAYYQLFRELTDVPAATLSHSFPPQP